MRRELNEEYEHLVEQYYALCVGHANGLSKFPRLARLCSEKWKLVPVYQGRITFKGYRRANIV